MLFYFGAQLLIAYSAVASEYYRTLTVNDYFGTQGKQPIVLYRAAISVLAPQHVASAGQLLRSPRAAVTTLRPIERQYACYALSINRK